MCLSHISRVWLRIDLLWFDLGAREYFMAFSVASGFARRSGAGTRLEKVRNHKFMQVWCSGWPVAGIDLEVI